MLWSISPGWKDRESFILSLLSHEAFRGILCCRLWLTSRSGVPQCQMLLRYREVCLSKGLPYNAVRIEIDLPVVVIMDIGPDRQHWTCQVELKDFYVRSRGCQNMGDLRKMLLQQTDGFWVIHTMV